MTEMSPVRTWDLLLDLGFREDPSEQQHGFSFDFGNFKLWALPCTGRRFVDVVLLTGVMVSKRSISEITAELPATVESAALGKALVAYYLDGAARDAFEFALTPPWLVEGRRYRHLLPWEKERAAYAARPHCYVDREWARVALKKLAEQQMLVDDESPVTLEFDGTVLTIRCSGAVSAMPATGNAWTNRFCIRAGALKPLPRRLMRSTVEVSIRDSTLIIGNVRDSAS